LQVVGLNALICWIIALPIAVLSESGYVIAVMIGSAVCMSNALKALAVSENSQRAVALYYLYRAAFIIILQFALVDFGMIGLTAGLAAGETVAACILIANLKPYMPGKLLLPARQYWRALIRHRAFTVFGVLQELVSIFVLIAPLMLADFMFSKAAVGNLGMAHRLTYGPASIVGANIGWVMLAALGRGNRAAGDSLASVRLFATVVILGFSCGALAFGASHFLLDRVVLGKWSLALELAPYLATAAIAFVFSVPYRQAIRVRRKQGVQLIIDATISVFMVAIALSGPSGMVSWISMTSSLMVAQNLALMLYVNRIFAKTNPS